MYPNIHAILIIMYTLPVASYECEQSISMLKFIKLLSEVQWVKANLID